MKRGSLSERIFIEDVGQAALSLKAATKGLSMGALVEKIRSQLGMSQSALAKRAKVPQSTISRLEKGTKNPTLSTLSKILDALFCDLLVLPLLRESVRGHSSKASQKASGAAC